jgi:hypothetical protein
MGLKVPLFVLVTPAAIGIRGCLLMFALWTFSGITSGFQIPLLRWAVQLAGSLLFPFWGLAIMVWAGPFFSPLTSLGSIAGALLGSYFLWRKSLERFSVWFLISEVVRTSEPPARLGRQRSAGQWRKSLSALGERWRGGEGTRGRAEPRFPTGRDPAASRPRENWLSRLMRRNPLVFRELLVRRGNKAVFFITVGLVSLFILYPAFGSPEHAPGVDPCRLLRAVSILLAVSIASWEGSRLLPPPSQGAFLETLLSTPLSGRSLILGGVVVAVLRLAPLLPQVLFSSFVGALYVSSFRSAAAWLSLFPACAVLAWGLSVWSSVLLGRRILAAAASFLLSSVLLAATAEYFVGDSQLQGRSSPGALVLGEAPPAATLTVSGYLAACGLVLVLAFAVWSRRGPLRGALRPR